MHPALDALNQALSYAKFSNPDIRKKTYNLIAILGADLDGPYEQGDDVENATDELVAEMDALDEAREELDEALEIPAVTSEEIKEE